ncbi:MAG TPA: class I SAM-dependent methyltransferase [Candidatus Acidoferrum sp.]|nr:class I SAM-dependent methyltransferase [Candidatus Acidoferrum sp.]
MADWYYDDLRQVGVDFEDPAAVEAYDRNQHTDAAEERALLDELGVGAGHVVIDIGCGTGAFAIEAAGRCRAVYAVDVSAGMLAFARRRADGYGLANLHFRRGGFLSYGHDGPPADLIVSKYAFHHLPDFWKGVALVRMKEMLGRGDRLFLRDVVFSFPPAEHRREIDAWIARMAQPSGEGFTAADFATHVRDEHSTYDWIIEGLLERTGFRIERKVHWDAVYMDYLCAKVA